MPQCFEIYHNYVNYKATIVNNNENNSFNFVVCFAFKFCILFNKIAVILVIFSVNEIYLTFYLYFLSRYSFKYNCIYPVFFFQYFGTGPGALRIGKISDKTKILGNFLISINHLDWKCV